MIQLFRNFFKSKIGIAFTLGFVGLIAFAFAAMDISGSPTFGGVSGSDRVAIVGKTKLSTSDLSAALNSDFEAFRRQNPTATMESFLATGAMEGALQQMLDRNALAEFARKYGLRAGDRLIDSELLQIPAFRGADGKFDQVAYRNILAQQGISEALLRTDLSSGLLARQVLLPIAMGNEMPASLARRYAALLRESRHGSIGILLSSAYAPAQGPSDAQLQKFYTDHRPEYLLPERRTIRYLTFNETALDSRPAPTEAEIAARYKRDAAQYAASETRRITQLVLPTKAAADDILKQVSTGKTLDAAAREKGLATTQIGPVNQVDLGRQTSAAVAQAAFASAQGSTSAPTRGSLGYYIIRVDAIERTPARSFEQVRGAIATALAAEKLQAALADLSGRIEDQIDNGSSLAEVAKSLGIEVKSAADVLADGRIYLKAGQTAPEELRPAISTAFDMQEGEPQLVEIVAGKTFLIFDVAKVTPSDAAPLGEIRDRVVADWKRAEGAKAAKAAADRVMKRVQQGETVAAALAREQVKLPPPDSINLNREQLSQLGGRVPPVLALMFSMAQGTTKRLEAPNDNGWFVVKLDRIEAGQLANDDPLVATARRDLTATLQGEYSQQFVRAISAEVGVERNQAAIKALETQLAGRDNRE